MLLLGVLIFGQSAKALDCTKNPVVKCIQNSNGLTQNCKNKITTEAQSMQSFRELLQCLNLGCVDPNSLPDLEEDEERYEGSLYSYCSALNNEIDKYSFKYKKAREILANQINEPGFSEVNVLIQWIEDNQYDIQEFVGDILTRQDRWNEGVIKKLVQYNIYDALIFFQYFKSTLDMTAGEVLAEKQDEAMFTFLINSSDLQLLDLLKHFSDELFKDDIYRKLFDMVLTQKEIPNSMVGVVVSQANAHDKNKLVEAILLEELNVNNSESFLDTLYPSYKDQLIVAYDDERLENRIIDYVKQLSKTKINKVITQLMKYSETEAYKARIILNQFIEQNKFRLGQHEAEVKRINQAKANAINEMRLKKLEDELNGIFLEPEEYEIDESLFLLPVFDDYSIEILASLDRHISGGNLLRESILHLYSNYPYYQQDKLVDYLKNLRGLNGDAIQIYGPLIEKVFPINEQLKILLSNFLDSNKKEYLPKILKFATETDLLKVLNHSEAHGINFWDLIERDYRENTEDWKKALADFIANNLSLNQPALGAFEDDAVEKTPFLFHEQYLASGDKNLINKSITAVAFSNLKYEFDLQELNEYGRLIQGVGQIPPQARFRIRRLVRDSDTTAKNILNDFQSFRIINGPEEAKALIKDLKRIVSLNTNLDKDKLRIAFKNTEKALITWQHQEHDISVNLLTTFIELVKIAIQRDQISISGDGKISDLYFHLFKKVNYTKSNTELKRYLSDTNVSMKSFMALASELIYLKLWFATQAQSEMNGLNREDLIRFGELIENYQRRISELLFAQTQYDFEEVQSQFLDASEDYQYTTSSAPLYGALICKSSATCFYNLIYSTNSHLLTNYISRPEVYSKVIEYPTTAIQANGTGTRRSEITNYRPRKISLSLFANDVTIVDMNIRNQIKPEQPLKGFHGQQQIIEYYQYKVEVCRSWAKWGKWCISHKTVERTGSRIKQHMQNGYTGRNGEVGIDSADFELFLKGTANENKFGKVIILNSSGNGGQGADGGNRCGQTCGNSPGAPGQGGAPGEVGKINVLNNLSEIEVIPVGKSGQQGPSGNTGSN